jgi:hypothetical protein
MFCAYRGIGILCCALSLALAGGCFENTGSADDGTDTGSSVGGTSDDGGEDSSDGDDGDDGTGGTTSSSDDETGTTGGVTSETGGTETGGSTGGGTGNTTSGDVIECAADPPVFPEFDKRCDTVSQCSLVFHTIDCCGTEVVWGINDNDVAHFDEAEAICDAQYPACGCPAGPTEAEDGDTGLVPEDFQIECTDGTCKSYVP